MSWSPALSLRQQLPWTEAASQEMASLAMEAPQTLLLQPPMLCHQAQQRAGAAALTLYLQS